MRAKEFTINVPINIKINGDGDPEIDMPSNKVDNKPDENPVFISPLQQELELKKSEAGKESAVIDKITAPEDIGDEDKHVDNNEKDELFRLIQMLKR